MKQILYALVVILPLSGCAIDPAAVALIPTPIPAPADQPCEPEWETVFYDEFGRDGRDIYVYCGNRLVDDMWLRDWAKDAVDRDDARRMLAAFGEGARMLAVTSVYMAFFLEADRSCHEGRGELASLIERYAAEYSQRAHIDFPLLAAAQALHSDFTPDGRYIVDQERSSEVDKVDCSDKFAALSATPDPPPLCLSAGGADAEMNCFNNMPMANSMEASDACDPVEAMIASGQAVSDEASDSLPAYIDMTEVTTALSGETLTVVFHLRDVPESLPFNRSDVVRGAEYSLVVLIDVDNDPDTGGHDGFEYILAAFSGGSGESGKSATASRDKVRAHTGKLGPDGASDFKEASVEISAQADTIKLEGEIPGISATSRLIFQSSDFVNGFDFDEIGCRVPVRLDDIGPGQCSGEEVTIAPGQSVSGEVTDNVPAHIDITEVGTTLAGETLTAVFHLRDVPETLTFDRTHVKDHVMEYSWRVWIDVDTDTDAGSPGVDYSLSTSHIVQSGDSGKNEAAPIESRAEAYIWRVGERSYRTIDAANFEVSADEDTITLVGNVPGISSRSRVAFEAYDFLYGSDQVACSGPAARQ